MDLIDQHDIFHLWLLFDEASELDPVNKHCLLEDALTWPLLFTGLNEIEKAIAVKKILKELTYYNNQAKEIF